MSPAKRQQDSWDDPAMREFVKSLGQPPVIIPPSLQGEGTVTVAEAAAILSRSPKLIYKIIKHGGLRYVRVGRSISILKTELRDFIQRSTTGGWAIQDDRKGGEQR